MNIQSCFKDALPGTLDYALSRAIESCHDVLASSDFEEHGGVVIHQAVNDIYKFVKLRNQNTGTEKAPFLFTADQNDYSKNILPLFKDGWKHYASFHTHPQFPANPSWTDMNELFPGFPINYIYSGSQNKLIKFEWIDPKDLQAGVTAELIHIDNERIN